MKTITFISDTHGKHNELTKDLPGGDFLIHAGDFTSRGFYEEIKNFCRWFDSLKNYDHKIFIAGNHELGIEDNQEQAMEIINSYKTIDYLFDSEVIIDDIKIYGSPWQPEFFDWAFNLPRNGEGLKEKWDMIPEDTDILVTHGPPFGILDIQSRGMHMGCELLYDRVNIVKPKIHVFGHNHFAYGQRFINNIHFINASVLDERYRYSKLPTTIEWNPKTNEFNFI